MPTEKARPPRLIRLAVRPAAPHDEKGEEEGDRQRDDDDERGPELGQEEEEDQDHEEASHQERVHDRLDAGLDQRRPVVEDVEPGALRQGGLDAGHRRLHPLHHRLGVLAAEHDDHARDRLSPAVARHRPLAHLGPDPHLGHVAHADREFRPSHFSTTGPMSSSEVKSPWPRM